MNPMPKTMLIEGRRYVVHTEVGEDQTTRFVRVEQPVKQEAPEAKGETNHDN
jgi:hypothetical protein